MVFVVLVFFLIKEIINYVRLCCFLVDVGLQVLREIFDRMYFLVNFYVVLVRFVVYVILQLLYRKKIINFIQWGKLYLFVVVLILLRDFDIMLFMILLRNICGMIFFIIGWDDFFVVIDVFFEVDIV